MPVIGHFFLYFCKNIGKIVIIMNKKSSRLYCFSPTVMLITFIFESFSAAFAIFKYKPSKIRTLIILLLMSLAGFQAAEFMVCGTEHFSGMDWARFGYLAITLLPPLGLNLAYEISGKKAGVLVKTSYLTCVAFAVYFVFVSGSVFAGDNTCRANYSVFNTPNGVATFLYALYYYGWLFVALFFCWNQISKISKEINHGILRLILSRSKKLNMIINGENLRKILALKWLIGGYVAFIMPTTIVNIINPSTIEGIPSIMCGFAVLMAITLIGFVAPRTLELKNK